MGSKQRVRSPSRTPGQGTFIEVPKGSKPLTRADIEARLEAQKKADEVEKQRQAELNNPFLNPQESIGRAILRSGMRSGKSIQHAQELRKYLEIK